ncbi:protein-tyrosine phosphatase-like protein [Thamnocephalis sphaerospora]|uniref:protein-tyrosine-phosphatase n=1 Tax=Thamnocephalis sphaerospora TaxID=78915 RepID=A0A4P9XXC4_9FUNG|nr:protein-tyrosine phosphatase-like protein [Thamnocephalis sphaerospora]|eukprot:RKP11093.1 protein-tyrosine phosphatase-like protein [Thamnocephalis sphaerospora]
MSAGTSMAGLINPPSLIEYGPLRLLIADAPSDHTLPIYIKEFAKYGVTDVVRVCEPTYQRARLERAGYRVHDWSFDDGCEPPDTIIEHWLGLLETRFGPEARLARSTNGVSGTRPPPDQLTDDTDLCVAIHCVAGLGRAPLLVAIALIEYGMSPLDSVAYVRERRRGAINNRQLRYVERYRRHTRKGCIIC